MLGVNGEDSLVREGGFMPLDNYNENLLDISGDDEWNIIKVYSALDSSRCLDFSITFRDCLFDRNISKITELTIEDIASKFNLDVDQIRIKD